MPGVPTSQACDACHGLKKKCDQAKPRCSRCARINIACTGAGRKRYIFKLTKPASASRPGGASELRNKIAPAAPTSILTVRSNDLNITRRMLIDVLEIRDARYSVGCYGDFLRHVPTRLGRSDALDASVRALISAFPSHYTGCLTSSALVDYGTALSALRLSLVRGDEAVTTETLCSIYLIMISQGWIGRFDHHRQTHGEILAHFIRSAAVRQWQEDFGLDLLASICLPLILEAIVNPAIQIDLSFLSTADSCEPLKGTGNNWIPEFPSLKLRTLARLPNMFRHPELYLSEIKSSYQDMGIDHQKLRLYLEYLGNGSLRSDAIKSQQHQQFLVVYAVLLIFITGLNFQLRCQNPTSTLLLNESHLFATETIALARLVSPHRPLGSSYILPCLATTWAATEDIAIQAETEKLIRDYQDDFPHSQWIDQSIWLKRMLEGCRSRLSGAPASATPEDKRKIYVSIAHNKAAFGLSGARILL
ncbi:hypothetical protein GQ53DRAFT_888905 [Thozetella sp. PMI_491]|nr:hypothetical protein GQ53DRAFT_888905 [Thozetella sp. PMI_491]